MLVVIDTGLATTKAAALIGTRMLDASYPSAVVRGLVSEQAGGVYCMGKTTANFQVYSALAQEQGLFAITQTNFRDPENAKRRVLVEHALAKLGARGKTSIILTQPAPLLFAGGENHTASLREAEASLLKMAVSIIEPDSGQPAAPAWKLNEVTAAVEAVWGLHDLALTPGGAALDNLGEFTRNRVKAGATVAVVDLGATGTRVHYVEWTGELLPDLVMSRYRECALGTEEVITQIDARLVERHGYRDVIDLPGLRTDPTLNLAGTRVDVSDLVQDGIKAAAARIMSAGLNQLHAEVASHEVDHVLFVGGGAHVLADLLADGLRPGSVLVAENPCMAPVRGLLKLRAASAGSGGGRS